MTPGPYFKTKGEPSKAKSKAGRISAEKKDPQFAAGLYNLQIA